MYNNLKQMILKGMYPSMSEMQLRLDVFKNNSKITHNQYEELTQLLLEQESK